MSGKSHTVAVGSSARPPAPVDVAVAAAPPSRPGAGGDAMTAPPAPPPVPASPPPATLPPSATPAVDIVSVFYAHVNRPDRPRWSTETARDPASSLNCSLNLDQLTMARHCCPDCPDPDEDVERHLATLTARFSLTRQRGSSYCDIGLMLHRFPALTLTLALADHLSHGMFGFDHLVMLTRCLDGAGDDSGGDGESLPGARALHNRIRTPVEEHDALTRPLGPGEQASTRTAAERATDRGTVQRRGTWWPSRTPRRPPSPRPGLPGRVDRGRHLSHRGGDRGVHGACQCAPDPRPCVHGGAHTDGVDHRVHPGRRRHLSFPWLRGPRRRLQPRPGEALRRRDPGGRWADLHHQPPLPPVGSTTR